MSDRNYPRLGSTRDIPGLCEKCFDDLFDEDTV